MHYYKFFELKCVCQCTQPPYNDKNPPSCYFYLFFYPFLKSSYLSMWRHTDGGPSHDCWLTVAFQHRLHWCLTSDPPWVSGHQLFHRRSRCRQEWLLSDWGVLLFHVIMNMAVVIYSRHLSGWRWLRLVFKGKKPLIYKCVSSLESFIIQLHLQKWVQGFLNESLQTAFPNNVLIIKLHDECG